MTKELQALVRMAKRAKMSPQEREAQRQSFAYGNANIENKHVTRKTVAKEAARLKVKYA
jgi:hypothetical protein